MKSHKDRYEDFKRGSPDVAISWLLDSMYNKFINTELRLAAECPLHYLLLMGIHGCILTINKYIFIKNGKNGFKWYLENFVDGDNAMFSKYYKEIYYRRNDLAHQWLSKTGHNFGFDHTIREGVRNENGDIIINTKKYFEFFTSSFEKGNETKNNIHDYIDSLSAAKKGKSKKIILDSYE